MIPIIRQENIINSTDDTYKSLIKQIKYLCVCLFVTHTAFEELRTILRIQLTTSDSPQVLVSVCVCVVCVCVCYLSARWRAQAAGSGRRRPCAATATSPSGCRLTPAGGAYVHT